ncbi:MAG TPA: hypothetical protein EYH34_02635 [Planctomycetes bacterium]|nr:hypothetical protein [Planctomycetota bacterium]
MNAWTKGPKPFTPAWYAQHPNAWKVTHPYAPAAAVALTTAAVAAWLTPPVAPIASTVVLQETVVVEGGTYPAVSAVDPAGEEGSGDGTQDASADVTEWLPVGIFTLYAPGETLATRMMELALLKDGRIGGTHYDRLRNQVDPITGSIDRSSMVLRWSVGEQGGVFEAPLDDLIKPEAGITVRLPDGAVTEWRLVRRDS